jgi:translation initiation factor 6 (eIF-6)
MNKTISPFADESESLGIGDLAIENRTDRISIYGSIDLTRDRAGLAHARMLKAVLDNVVQVLEVPVHLPSQAESGMVRCGSPLRALASRSVM